MKKKLLLYFVLIFTASCSNEELIDDNLIKSVPMAEKEPIVMKSQFARALAKGLEESEDLRSIVKEEALKMFDKDFNVLYLAIKNKRIENGISIKEFLANFFENPEYLDLIETVLPTLTIYVPSLPKETFSAKNWKVQTQIPLVAVEDFKNKKIIYFKEGTEEVEVKSSLIPAFPVVAVKLNDRILSTTSQERTSSTRNAAEDLFLNNKKLKFLDKSFNNTSIVSNKQQISSNSSSNIIPPLPHNAYGAKVIQASQEFDNDGWQRDYVYYDLTNQNTVGEFDNDYQEHIASFVLNGDPMSAYSKISDQNDPSLLSSSELDDETSFWTEGFFEFKFTVMFNAKNGLGENIEIYQSIDPSDLFKVNYMDLSILFLDFYVMTDIEHKHVYLNLPMFNWDLQDYASSIKITVEEVDLSETITTTDTRTVEFATNFEANADAIKSKVGLKFGGSFKDTQTYTVQRMYQLGNDQLGSVIVNFGDKIITGPAGGNMLQPRVYETGWYKLTVRPKKVQ